MVFLLPETDLKNKTHFQGMLASGKSSLFGWEARAAFPALAGAHALPTGKEQMPTEPVLPW